MDRKVVFLFRPGKAARRVTHTFSFGSARQPFLHKLLHPGARFSRGIDWSDGAVRELMRHLYPSTIVRCLMHAQLVARHAPPKFSTLCTSDANIKDSIVVIPKHLTDNEELLRTLRRKNNVLLADLIDGIFDESLAARFDGLVCCSRKGYAHYASLPGMPAVFFVEHCADARLPQAAESPPLFSPYYFGAPQNLFIYDSLRPLLTLIFTDTDNIANLDWMQSLPLANFHYAVRPASVKPAFKPFMKGITAAHGNANILVHKDDGDAALCLGEDYPYLIHEEPGENVLRDIMAKARDDFGGKEWAYGLSVMRELKENSSEAVIARQFWDMIAAVA